MWIELVGKGAGIDSAWDYGQQYGSPPTTTNGSETLIPAAIAAAGVKREDVMITSKIPCSGFDGGREPMNATMAEQYIEANLEMLQTDYVDLLLLHHVCRTMEETVMVWRVLEAAKAKGQAKAIGVSNFIQADLEALTNAGLKEPVSANQCHFTVGQMDRHTLAWCREHGVALSSYGTLHGPYGMDHPAIQAVAARHNKSNAEVMLRYVIQHGIAIVTASNRMSYDLEDSSLFQWNLTAQDISDLDSVQQESSLSCSDCYALPCRTCQDTIRAAGCGGFVDHYDHTGCMACVANLTAAKAAKVKAKCTEDLVFKACW